VGAAVATPRGKRKKGCYVLFTTTHGLATRWGMAGYEGFVRSENELLKAFRAEPKKDSKPTHASDADDQWRGTTVECPV